MTTCVLLVEDDAAVRSMLRLLLEDEGYRVVEAADGERAMERFQADRPDLVVVDLKLPKASGFDVCRHIRASSDVPIIVVTAQVDTPDVVAALELGADDYVTKPYVPRELLARVRALLRRAGGSAHETEVVRVGPVEIRRSEGVVLKHGQPLDLTKTEYLLLADLAQNSGQVMSRESLLSRVWGYDHIGDTRLVDSHMSRLRNKVEDDPADPVFIVTVRGFGYKLVREVMDTRSRRHVLGMRGRFIAAFAAAGLILTVVLSLLTYELTRSYLTGQRERSATRQAFANARLATSVLGADDSDPRKLLDSLPAESDSRVLINVSGTWFSSDVGLSEASLPPDFVRIVTQGRAASQRSRVDGTTQLAIGTPLGSTNSSYFEVFPLRELNQTLRALATSLALASLVTTGLGAVGGWYASRRVLVPLQRVSSASERIARGALGTRLRAAGDADLQPLVDSFNSMADALQDRIEREARFASDVSHELRTPLTALATAVQVLQSRADEMPQRVRAAIDVLESQIEYFERLVLDLLEISRYDAGVNELANEEVEPVEFMRAALAPLDPAPLRVTTAMPSAVSIDTRRVERILANLVENAQVHAGGVDAVELSAVNGELRISVLDQGPGIASEDRAFVFERFRRGTTSATNAVKGTGLGLALVAEHARLHGGTVAMQPRDPTGCRFTVSIPIGESTCA